MLILNGLAYEPGAPEITLLNRGFRFGDGLFAQWRIWEGKPLFLEEQLLQLVQGMKLMKFEFEFESWTATLRHELKRAMQLNALTRHGRVRAYVYRAGTGNYAPLDDRPLYLIEADSFKMDPFEHPNPVSLTTFKEFPVHYSPLSAYEGSQTMAYILAARHARTTGFDEGLLLCGGFASETSHHQVFMVKDRKLYTPPLQSGCRDSQMRRQVFRMCQELKIPCQEKKLRPAQLRQADELFVCNDAQGLLPVSRLDQQVFFPERYLIHPFLANSWLRYVRQLLR